MTKDNKYDFGSRYIIVLLQSYHVLYQLNRLYVEFQTERA